MNKVLIVDTDGKQLTATQRRLRKEFDAHIALGPQLGVQRMHEDGPFAVVIAEFSMPGTDGIAFLSEVRKKWPQTARILLSRTPMDVSDLLRAVNEAKVFHVLSASCEDQALADIVRKGVESVTHIATLTNGMIEVHATFAKAVHEIVCWVRNDVKGMLSPILPILRALCHKMKDPHPLMTETAFLTSIIGLIALPNSLLAKITAGHELTEEERLIFAGHPEHAVELLRHLPQMNSTADVLRGYANFLHLALRHENDEITDIPDISVGSKVLALAMEYRLALYKNLTAEAIITKLAATGLHATDAIKHLVAVLKNMDTEESELSLDRLQPGMIVAKAVTGFRDGKDVVLVSEGYELARTTILFLRQSARHGVVVREPVMVRKSSFTHQEDNGSA